MGCDAHVWDSPVAFTSRTRWEGAQVQLALAFGVRE